ncbi:MAG TPA: GAF domain-containing protein, partial [Geodermatophilus sp.]|nr:GAF domain-containing protein [Geodermatophilus sp.]
MARKRTDAEQQVAELLRTARTSLQMSVAFLSRMDGTTQTFEVVDSKVPVLFKDGATARQDTSFCQKILDGDLPPVIDDVKKYPLAMSLPAARIPRIRSYVSAPVTLADGTLYGTFCAFGFTSDKELTGRDESLMKVLASAASVIIEPEVREQQRRDDID